MMHYTDLTGLAGIAFAIVALALRLPVVTRLQFKLKLLLAGALLIAVTLPLGALSLVESVRGVSGDLSITTLLLLVLLHVPSPSGGRGRGGLLVLIAFGAVVLYPFALGVGMFDTYRLGFGDLWLVAGLLLIAVLAWLRRFTLVALSISLAVLAWSAGWYESGNLWDYLIDPWVAIYAIAALLKLLVSRIRRSI
jgi:hypothetical protein